MDPKSPNLTKYLGQCGVASRRRAAEIIRDGRVTVDGVVVTDPALRVASGSQVRVDGRAATPPEHFHYIMMNKPRGWVCSNADAHAEHLAVELIDRFPGCFLRSAGRLDKESEGLIVFSDDGDYLERVAHPRYQVTKLYEVAVENPLDDRSLAAMCRGVTESGELLRVLEAVRLAPRLYRFRLNEGKKREIRRLCAFFGSRVTRLKRIALGALAIGALKPGEYRELAPDEVAMTLRGDPAAHRGE